MPLTNCEDFCLRFPGLRTSWVIGGRRGPTQQLGLLAVGGGAGATYGKVRLLSAGLAVWESRSSNLLI